MKMKNVIALLLVVMVLVACANQPAGGGAVAPAPAAQGGTTEAAAPAPAAGNDEADASVSGRDTVVVASPVEPVTLFPFHSTLNTSMDTVPIQHNVFDPIVRMTADGEILPMLAHDWHIAENGMYLRLYIRDDVYFHNGYKMIAEDVAWTLNEAAPSRQGIAQLANFDRAEVTGEWEVTVFLTAPYAPFINGLANRFALVVSRQLFDEIGEDALNEHPIGTGPYKFVERVPGDSIYLVRNENYWGGVPEIENIIFRVIPDANTQMIALEAGDIDVLIRGSTSLLARLDVPHLDVDFVDSAGSGTLRFNLVSGPASNFYFRRFLQHMANRDDIILGAFEGTASPAWMQIPHHFTGSPAPGTYTRFPFDQDLARHYLELSGYAGEEFHLKVIAGTPDDSALQIFQGQLIEMGINTRVSQVDAPSFNAMGQAGEYHASIRSNAVSVMDGDGIYHMWHSAHYTPGHFDAGHFTDEMDDLLDLSRIVIDPAERAAIFRDVVEKINQDALALSLYYAPSAVAWNSSRLGGVHAHPLFAKFYFTDWYWVD